MSHDQNTTQETAGTSIPQDTPVNMGSDTSSTSPEAVNAPADVSTPEVVNNTTPKNTENKAETAENGQNTGNPLENQGSDIQSNPEPVPEPIPEPVQVTEPPTAQIPPNEPLTSEPEPIEPEPIPVIIPNKNKVLELLNKAKLAIQSRKRKKLDKIMTLFLKKKKITNNEVEKFLHVSDATAERYLNILEKEGKIKQAGKTGHSVFYIKI
jgi:hypothetical protein